MHNFNIPKEKQIRVILNTDVKYGKKCILLEQ